MPADPAGCWVTHGTSSGWVSFTVGCLTSRPSPGLIGPGSFARVSSPLRSSFASSPGRPSSERPLLLGFLPSSRRHRRRPRLREIPPSRFVPPSGFLSLSAAFSAIGFTGLFHPAATSRVPPSRGFSRSAVVPDSSSGPAPLSFRRADSPATRLPSTRLRLRGLIPRIDAFLGVGV
jgi:hypothetical protein